jgi:hypothetical protein
LYQRGEAEGGGDQKAVYKTKLALDLSLLFKNAVTVVERHRRTKQYTVGIRNCLFARMADPLCKMCADGVDSSQDAAYSTQVLRRILHPGMEGIDLSGSRVESTRTLLFYLRRLQYMDHSSSHAVETAMTKSIPQGLRKRLEFVSSDSVSSGKWLHRHDLVVVGEATTEKNFQQIEQLLRQDNGVLVAHNMEILSVATAVKAAVRDNWLWYVCSCL